MGIPIPMLDLMFFLTENQDNPRHVGAVLIFQRPRRCGADFLDRIVDAYRRATPVPPFNRIPVLRRIGLPEWQEVDQFDANYHLQRRTAARRRAPTRSWTNSSPNCTRRCSIAGIQAGRCT